MNRFPAWKYVLIGLVVLAGALYTVPNFYGESPAVQVSSAKSTVRVDAAVMGQVEAVLGKQGLAYTGAQRTRIPFDFDPAQGKHAGQPGDRDQ